MSTVVSQYKIARTAFQRVCFERCYHHPRAIVEINKVWLLRCEYARTCSKLLATLRIHPN